MAPVFARVQIEDFDRFMETFAGRGLEKRREHGSRGARVHRSLDNPNQLVNVFDWDREGVEAFMADPEASEIMSDAGLLAPPEFTYVEEAAQLEA